MFYLNENTHIYIIKRCVIFKIKMEIDCFQTSVLQTCDSNSESCRSNVIPTIRYIDSEIVS